MKHLFEIFQDNIFDNQMRIWSVLSYNKFNKSKSKAYKFPYHNISVPTKQLGKNKYGIQVDKKLLVAEHDKLTAKKHYSLRLVKKHLKQKRLRKLNKKSYNSFFSFTGNQSSMTNYAEIEYKNINKDIEVQVYKIKNKKRVINKQFTVNTLPNKILISFDEINVKDIIFRIKDNNLNDSTPILFNFYNTKLSKPPFFVHNKLKAYNLKKFKTYKISMDIYNSEKFVIFYKYAKNKSQLKNRKWKAKNTISNQFTPVLNGFYQFMIVYDYLSPLSMCGEFSLDEIDYKK